MPARRRDPISVPRTFHSPSAIRHDYGIDESISRAGYFSNAILQDTDDAAARSRGKDYDLLRNTQSAIIDTEMHVSPRAAAASMRARASSVPPKVQGRPARLQQQLLLRNRPKVVGSPLPAPTLVCVSTPLVAHPPNPSRYHQPSTPVVTRGEVPWRLRGRAGSLPPRPQSYHADYSYEPERPPLVLATENMRAHRPPSVLRSSRAGSVPPLSMRAGSLPPQRAVVSANQPARLVRAGSLQSLARPGYGNIHPGAVRCVGTEGLRANRPPVASRLGRAHSVGRLNYAPYDFEADVDNYIGAPVASLRKQPHQQPRGGTRVADKGRPPVRRFASSRAVSEPPGYIPPSQNYPPISDIVPRVVARQLYSRRGQAPKPPMIARPKAAIIGSKMETEDDGKKKRKLRPAYVLDKSREGSCQSAIYGGDPILSTGLHSSRPPLPKLTERKPIRSVDGFTKPKNVMSWEYRVESRLSPDDLLYTPSSFGRMRDQVRSAQDKLDRHRQLLDRYLDPDMKPASSYTSNRVSPPSSSAGGNPETAPMSDLRRRLRRTLAKTKNNPDLYKE